MITKMERVAPLVIPQPIVTWENADDKVIARALEEFENDYLEETMKKSGICSIL